MQGKNYKNKQEILINQIILISCSSNYFCAMSGYAPMNRWNWHIPRGDSTWKKNCIHAWIEEISKEWIAAYYRPT